MAHNNPIRVPSAETIAREQHVLELRRAGLTFDRIAEEVGIGDRSDAHKIYKRALARTLQEPAADIRRLEGDRLDRLQVAVWTRALRGDLAAVDRVLRIMERRSRLLGLDHADGIAERALAIEAGKVRLMAMALGRMFDALELDEEQRQRGTEVLFAELRALAAVDEDDETDTDDDTDQAEPGDVVAGEVTS